MNGRQDAFHKQMRQSYFQQRCGSTPLVDVYACGKQHALAAVGTLHRLTTAPINSKHLASFEAAGVP
jgi:hypothetical protein